MGTKRSFVCGVGVNDADYSISSTENGKYVKCHFYSKWKSMIYRCYSKKSFIKDPSYENCRVSDDWLTFSNFKRWMESQDWKGNHIDKDLLSGGSKIYSKDTCCFISEEVNNFLVDRVHTSKFMNGVSWCRARGLYQSHISDTFLKKSVSLGRYKTELEAHLAWRRRKHEIAIILAEKQKDHRIKDALLRRYAPEPMDG